MLNLNVLLLISTKYSFKLSPGLFGNIFIGSSLARMVAAATPHREEKRKENKKTNNNSISAFHLICKISTLLINIIVMIIVIAIVATI